MVECLILSAPMYGITCIDCHLVGDIYLELRHEAEIPQKAFHHSVVSAVGVTIVQPNVQKEGNLNTAFRHDGKARMPKYSYLLHFVCVGIVGVKAAFFHI